MATATVPTGTLVPNRPLAAARGWQPSRRTASTNGKTRPVAPGQSRPTGQLLICNTLSGYAELPADIRIERADSGRGRLTAYTPLLTIEVIERSDGSELRWALGAQDRDVELRADALDFLHALHGVGALTPAEEGRELAPPVRLTPQAWPDDLDFDWRFVAALATLAEWSGTNLRLPSAASAEEVREVLQAADWVVTERIDATVTGPFEATLPTASLPPSPDELRIEQDFGVNFQGVEIPIGTGSASVAVEVKAAVPSQANPDVSNVVLMPRPASESIVFYLRAPATRRLPPRRTQLPAEEVWRRHIDGDAAISSQIDDFLTRFDAGHADRPPSALAHIVPLSAPDATLTASRILEELREEG